MSRFSGVYNCNVQVETHFVLLQSTYKRNMSFIAYRDFISLRSIKYVVNQPRVLLRRIVVSAYSGSVIPIICDQ